MEEVNKNTEVDNTDKKLHISDVINSNLVDDKLDVVGVLQQIFDEECSKAVLKGIINQQGGDDEKEVG